MNKSLAIFGLACCLCTASAGTLKAAAAEAISDISDSKFEARGGHGGGGHGGGHGGEGHGPPHHGGHGGGGGGGGHGGSSLELGLGGGPGGGWGPYGGGLGPNGSPLHGNESFGGPTVIALALPIAVLLIIALWVAAYNTLRSPAPKIGYNAGLVEQAGWGNQQGAQAYVSGGYGYADAAASDPHSAAASSLAASTLVQAAAAQGAAGGVAAGRALDNLTHRVVRSIERQEKKY